MSDTTGPNNERLVHAARELLAAASEAVKFPAGRDYTEELAIVPANLLDFLKDALGPATADMPSVTIDPLVGFGQPCLRGTRLRASFIAERYWHLGEDLEDEILRAYQITRNDVLVCCYYAASYGTRTQRARWESWRSSVLSRTGQDSAGVNHGWWSDDWADVELPPTRKEAEIALP